MFLLEALELGVELSVTILEVVAFIFKVLYLLHLSLEHDQDLFFDFCEVLVAVLGATEVLVELAIEVKLVKVDTRLKLPLLHTSRHK